MNTFGPPKLVLARGEGAHVWDADGKEYVDLLGGIAVNALGHAHPALVAAVTEQLDDPRPRLQLLHQRAAGRAGRAAPVARRRRRPGLLHQLRHRGQRGGVQADPAHRPHPPGRRRGLLPRPHHGRARADLQGGLPRRPSSRCRATSPSSRTATRPRSRGPSPTRPRPSSSSRSRARPASSSRPPTTSAAAREITRDNGALLWLDEVQTGIGRTGEWFAGDGRPTPTSSPWPRASAAASRSAPASASATPATLLQPGNHGTTFGGNPVACAAALAVLDTIEKDGLLEHATAIGRAAPRRTGRRRAGHRGARTGPAHRARPVRARSRPRSPPPPSPTASSSTTRLPTVSASLRPW